MGMVDKIDVLKGIAKAFNRAKVTWSLGASMLLYFKGIASDFNDIDLMVTNEDVTVVKKIMENLQGKRQPPNPNEKYSTKTFLEYEMQGVDVDIMAGFVIVSGENVYDCSLYPNQIVEYMDLDGEKIPLQSPDLWLRYYELMGREQKVQMIKRATESETRA